MSDLKVKKRDGSLEKWNYDKVLLSIGKAMMPIKKAEKIATKVEKWADKEAKKGVVDSVKIRDKIIEFLEEMDPVAAGAYKVYKKY